jgi:hypothetical protein
MSIATDCCRPQQRKRQLLHKTLVGQSTYVIAKGTAAIHRVFNTLRTQALAFQRAAQH